MKNYNLFYWIVAPGLILVLVYFSKKFTLSHHEFFGEAEARQSEINLDRDVMISNILVTTGQQVKKGQRILVVENTDIDQNIRQLDFEIQSIQSDKSKEKEDLLAKLLESQQKKQTTLADLTTRYEETKAEKNFYQQLTGKPDISASENNPTDVKLSALEKEMAKVKDEFDAQIKHYKVMMASLDKEDWAKNQVKQQQEYLLENKKMFEVVAPYDGIVGHIHVQQGEYVKAYSSLVTYIEPYPSEIKGYVQEKYTVNLQIGDTVFIASPYHTEKKSFGVISAIGNRVIEIPEKFRKIPDLKLYGIEVFIHLPESNTFYQKEIVQIKPRTY